MTARLRLESKNGIATITLAEPDKMNALSLGMLDALVEALDSAGPFGVGWPGPRVALGPVHLIRAEIVGNAHLRVIAGGPDGASIKAIAFRQAETPMGQALLHGAQGRRLWLAGRAKIDDWSGAPRAELHLEDAAWAD